MVQFCVGGRIDGGYLIREQCAWQHGKYMVCKLYCDCFIPYSELLKEPVRLTWGFKVHVSLPNTSVMYTAIKRHTSDAAPGFTVPTFAGRKISRSRRVHCAGVGKFPCWLSRGGILITTAIAMGASMCGMFTLLCGVCRFVLMLAESSVGNQCACFSTLVALSGRTTQ